LPSWPLWIEPTTGIEPFDRLVAQVMTTQPYASAERVFWIVDNGSSHRGQASIRRLEGKYANLWLIHLPVHASWLNQIEIFFSIVQRKVLTPNDFVDLVEVEHRLLGFQRRYEQTAQPFDWRYTRSDLDDSYVDWMTRSSSPKSHDHTTHELPYVSTWHHGVRRFESCPGL
jgi:DDE superfamily endonuclease